MRKINRQDIARMVIVLLLVAGVALAANSVGRFTPTHAIVEPVYCGSCHVDQVRELNATTHLPHFAGAIYEEAEAISAGTSAEVAQAEAVSGACMMCHNTWANRERIFVNGYNIVENVSGTGQYQLKFNDITFKSTNDAIQYNIVVPNASVLPKLIRLGSNVSSVKVYVQDPGTSGLVYGSKLTAPPDYVLNGTIGIDLLNAGNTTLLAAGAGDGTIYITYKVTQGNVSSLKTVWGDLSALSPTPGAFYNDQSGSNSCANPEKGFCHAVETAVGKNIKNLMAENQIPNGGSGSGIYFQHEMAYTSTEYAAKQVKFCGVCHFNKLPPMTADGEPIRQDLPNDAVVLRISHGTEILNTQNVTTVSPDWAHKQVQCIRCHSHAGIGPLDGLTGVRSD